MAEEKYLNRKFCSERGVQSNYLSHLADSILDTVNLHAENRQYDDNMFHFFIFKFCENLSRFGAIRTLCCNYNKVLFLQKTAQDHEEAPYVQFRREQY